MCDLQSALINGDTAMTNLSTTTTDKAKLASNGYTRIMPMADYLGVHHQSIRRWIKQGKMPAPKLVNGLQLFDNAEIKAWLENQQSANEGV